MSYTQIKYEQIDRIAIVTFNRPERVNALTKVMEAELRDAMDRAGADPAVRAIIVTGAGRAFCAGMDMDELEVLPPDDIREQKWMRPFDMNRRADYQTRYSYFPSIQKPVIAAINGAAAGLGLVLSLYSDFRFASDKAVFSTAFAKRGLIAEHGIAWMLPRVVGHANALDLLLSSRKVEAQEALKIGLVHRVLEAEALMETAMTYARELTELVSPRSLRIMKRQLWEAPFQSLADAVAVANLEMWHSLQSEDFKEGVAHFLEKRSPRFSGN